MARKELRKEECDSVINFKEIARKILNVPKKENCDQEIPNVKIERKAES